MKAYENAVYFSKDARQTYVSFRTAVLIPAGIAFIVGFCIGGVATGFYLWQGLGSIAEAAQFALMIGSMSALVAFVIVILWWREMVTGVEVTLQALAYPGVAIEPIRIELAENAGRVLHLEKLPGTRAQLTAVARMANAGNSLSIASLKSVMSDSEAREFQSALINHGYAAWRHPEAPQQGIRITSKGKALFGQAAQLAIPSPTPTETGRLPHGFTPATHAPHAPGWGYDD